MKKRKDCNRVMGCPASIELAGLGTATEAAIIQVLRKEKGADGYWVIKCIDLLGQLGRQDSAVFLSSLLDDKRTEVRTRAAVALGRLSAPSTKEAVESTFTRIKDGPDLGFKIALLYAIDRIGPFSTQRRKDAAKLLPQDKAGLGKISPLHLITAAEVAKEWPIPEALGSLRILASHIGPFIRRQAIDALGRLKDTGAIPVLVGRLKDEVPSIRTASMRALRAITGNTGPKTEEAWEAWCSKRECRTPPPRK
jgi:HEAT repeat protein